MPISLTDNEYPATVFKALAHPARLGVVQMLAEKEFCVQEITAAIGSDISTISRHLSVLRQSGILASRREGNCIYYSLRTPCVLSFIECVRSLSAETSEPDSDACTACGKVK
ncbi:metalloregulator ArsR/SmtB family transcription factor [Myxococcota bacterium]|nr:metalloregulator ArsR/SmtB family transcription factor [Myxococcota bacterium]MBU1534924.1 metalloregulator ArsR/SmtB family transcription factor [Myxococcota bacterium]